MLSDYAALIDDQHVWAAELDGKIIGVLVQFATPEGWYIDTVAISPARQGTGLGRQLLVFAEAQAHSAGLGQVYLCTNTKMTENQVFYPKLGYTEYERKQVEGYDRTYYRKRIT